MAVYVQENSEWVKKRPRYWDGTQWRNARARYWTGSQWVPQYQAVTELLSGQPASQVANGPEDDLNVLGSVTSPSGEPIEWVYSTDGTNWSSFDPAGKVRQVVFRNTFSDTFDAALNTDDWAVADANDSFGYRDPTQVESGSGELIITGSQDATAGSRFGSVAHDFEQMFGRWSVTMRADVDATNTFRANIATWSSEASANGEASAGRFALAHMPSATAASRELRGSAVGSVDGTNSIETSFDYGVNATTSRTYSVEWFSSHMSFYVDGVLNNTITQSNGTPLPTWPQYVLIQLLAEQNSYTGGDVKLYVSDYTVDRLAIGNIFIKARLASDPTVETDISTLSVALFGNYVQFVNNLPPATVAASPHTISADWNVNAPYRVERATSSNPNGWTLLEAGSGLGVSYSLTAEENAGGNRYRVVVSPNGYNFVSTVTEVPSLGGPVATSNRNSIMLTTGYLGSGA